MRRKKQSKFAGKLIVVIILLVFIGSLFAITQFSSGDDVTGSAAIQISGYAFYEDSGFYVAPDYGVGFLSNPEELGDIDINHDALTLLDGTDLVYITYNPNGLAQNGAMLAYRELASVLINFKGKTVVMSFTEDQTPPNPDVPLHTCADVGSSVGVIELRRSGSAGTEGGAAQIDVEGGCVVIQGEDEQAILRASSKLAMYLVGIEL